MSEFPCGNHVYTASKLDARTQFHIVRRLAPFLKGLVPIIGKIKSEGVESGSIDPSEGIKMLPEIGDVLAKMDDETADYVVFGLLAVVRRKQDNGMGWAPVSTGHSLMFADISMPQMLTLAGRALAANMGDFFAVLNSALSQHGQKQSGQ